MDSRGYTEMTDEDLRDFMLAVLPIRPFDLPALPLCDDPGIVELPLHEETWTDEQRETVKDVLLWSSYHDQLKLWAESRYNAAEALIEERRRRSKLDTETPF
jgi:hypothetical protein